MDVSKELGILSSWQKRLGGTRARLERRYLIGQKVSWLGRALLIAHSTLKTAHQLDIFSKAAALSYTLVFSLVPLVTTLLAFLTAFPGLQAERENFISLLSSYLLPGAVQDVQGQLAQFSSQAAAAGALSSLVFFVMVMMLFQAMEVALNGIWDAERQRSWTERLRTLAFFLIVAGLVTTVFVVLRNELTHVTQGLAGRAIPPSEDFLSRVGSWLVSIFVAWTLFVFSIRFLPNVRVQWRPAFVGGLIAGTLWHFLKSGFTWYVQNVASYSSIYGTLGVIPIFFLWLYLSFLLLLLGACIAYAIQCLRDSIYKKQSLGKDYPRGFYSLVVAIEIAAAFERGEGALTKTELTERAKLSSFCVDDALAWLCESGVVLEVPGISSHYILAQPSGSVSIWAVVEGVSGGTLQVPNLNDPSPLHRRIEKIFRDARSSTVRSLQQNLADMARGQGKILELESASDRV